MTANTWPFNAGSPGGKWTVNAPKHHRNVSGALIILIDVDLFQLPQISIQKDTCSLERVLPNVVKNRGAPHMYAKRENPQLYSHNRVSFGNLFSLVILSQ